MKICRKACLLTIHVRKHIDREGKEALQDADIHDVLDGVRLLALTQLLHAPACAWVGWVRGQGDRRRKQGGQPHPPSHVLTPTHLLSTRSVELVAMACEFSASWSFCFSFSSFSIFRRCSWPSRAALNSLHGE